MNRKRYVIALMSVLACCWALGAIAQQAPVIIVANGHPVGIDNVRSSEYTQAEGYIEQSGSRYLHPIHTLPGGDFTVVWDMSWEEPCAAGTNGNTIFGKPRANNVTIFAGGTDNTFRMRYVTGSANADLYDIGPFNDIVPTAERFQYAIKSKDGYWSYWVNGVKVADAEDHGYLFPGFADGDTPAELGIRPWSNRVRVFNWHQYSRYVEDTTPVEAPQLAVEGAWLTLEEAEAALGSAGLSVGNVSEQWSDTVPAGMVITQHPAPGAFLPPGSAVNLVLSAGPSPNIFQVPGAGVLALFVLAGLCVLCGAFAVRRFAH